MNIKKLNSLIVLINSLSKAEKRYFRLLSNLQSGEKIYLFLFDLIEKNTASEDIYLQFSQKQNGKSFEMAIKHLYNTLLDCLLRLRDNQNIQTQICNHISKSGILFERELFDESFTELDKAKRLAIDYEIDPLQLLIRRTELKYLSILDFKGYSEKQLVSKQMKINELMKYSRSINLHLQLYDILKHRLIYKGYARSDRQKEDLNDLVLSELNLIANSSYKGFEAEKLHMLFQATYYLNSGNYKSALRFYQELIHLFEENKHLLLNPPVYYLSALQGILNSLHMAGLYSEMPYFITKLKEIELGEYSTEFILFIRSQIYLYESIRTINTGQLSEAKKQLDNSEEILFRKASLLGLEAQLQIYLNAAITYLYNGEYSNARKSMKKIFSSGKVFHTFPLYKTARLVNLLIQAEIGNYDFLENEINSIKRNIRTEKQTLNTEKLIFRFVMAYPLPTYIPEKEILWKKFQNDINTIRNNKYEQKLLKTFHFLAWLEHRITGASLDNILIQKI